MKRKLAFGSRPKKRGAKKKYRLKTHKKRLVAAGYEEAFLNKLNPAQIRLLLMKIARKRAPKNARVAVKARKDAKAAKKAE
jgi:hypothetical protein